MPIGKIKFYDQRKSYGFLTPDDGSEELFFHKSDTLESVTKKDSVEYEVVENKNGLVATNIKKITNYTT